MLNLSVSNIFIITDDVGKSFVKSAAGCQNAVKVAIVGKTKQVSLNSFLLRGGFCFVHRFAGNKGIKAMDRSGVKSGTRRNRSYGIKQFVIDLNAAVN